MVKPGVCQNKAARMFSLGKHPRRYSWISRAH
jgi:ribosomal protein L24E